jgi:prepilin-type N-terminal cleavage/methylation domain-containing protein
MIMYRNREKRAVRMLDLTCPQARQRYSCFRRNTGYDLRGISGGFTLVELLIVIAIIAIAALTAIPMMSSAASVQIRSAANMITADLEYAKSMAISRAQYFSVVFDKNTESYWIEDQDGNVLPHPVKKGFDYVIDFQNDGRLNKVDIVDVDFDATSEVKFDYLGSPYNGNGTPLNSGVISLQAGGTTTTVTVEPVTGFVSIQ